MARNELAIMKRGKRTVAHYVKSECTRNAPGSPQLSELLNYLLDCNKTIKDYERLDWIRWLISGGETFDEFAKTVRKYDNATTCGLVWTADFVAYRCRTCGISPCMSLCADCFQAGNHSGHDFNMFRSQAGGACDCGDVSVMKECGFCQRHGPERGGGQQPAAPPELLAVAESMMPRLFFRLLQHMRSNALPVVLDSYMVAMQDCEELLTFLHQVSDMGAAMRKIMTKALTNPHSYTSLTQQSDSNTVSSDSFLHPLHPYRDDYERALLTLSAPAQPEEFAGIMDLASPLKHGTILEELLFWVIRFEFPQKLVTLLLSILPDEEYKEAFTRAFVQHYARIAVALVGSKDRVRISNRVVHISVQLLSPEALATLMVSKFHLLHIMLASLQHMMKNILVDAGGMAIQTGRDQDQNCHHVVSCANDVLKGHCYWPIVSDLINVLSHKSIAFQFMADTNLLTFWFDLLSYFQGMNVNQRESMQHVEYEPDTYYAAFSAELEICSSTMWSMLVHCKNESTLELTRKVIKVVIQSLRTWMNAINLAPHARLPWEQVTFHLPLHRHLAVFLSHAVKYQGLRNISSILPVADFMQMLMVHPLHIQVVFTEIFCGLWVRNGLQIRGQAMTYIQCHFCNSMIDADLYLLQVCGLSLSPDFFIRNVLERFHVMEHLTFAARDVRPVAPVLSQEHEMPVLEGALALLCTLLSVRTQLGASDTELTRQEMVALLAMSDRTHSQLMDTMPEKCGLTGQAKDFEPTLKEVADYKAPNFEAGGGMQQGMYVPKSVVWEKLYDPLYVALRAMYRRDSQAAMDRYTAHVKQHGLFSGSGAPWPPLRIPAPCHEEYAGLMRLLHSPTMHGIIFMLLHKSVHEKTTSDAVMYYTVFLLELCATIPSPSAPHTLTPNPQSRDRAFHEWFPSTSIWENVLHEISDVAVSVLTEESPMESPRTSCSSTSTSNSSMYQQAATPTGSQTTTSGGNLAFASAPASLATATVAMIPEGTSSEAINLVQAALEQTAAQIEEAATNALAASAAVPKYRSAGATANFSQRTQTVMVPVRETILSLLLQLHTKLSSSSGGSGASYVPESRRARPATEAEMESRVGDGAFFVAKVLDKLGRGSERCRQRLDEMYLKSIAPKEGEHGGAQPKKKKASDMEERRRRAREKQQRVMADFANKQKVFMEKNMASAADMDLSDSAAEEEQPTAENTDTLFDCVICNQQTASTQDRPVGLVALLQPTSVLGQRQRNDDQHELPVDESMTQPIIDNCVKDFKKHLMLMLQHLEETSCLMSVNIGWEGGVHVQTCGHHVHLNCHHAYLESIKNQRQLHQSLRVNKGEFQCPLCRQLSNTALPIVPGVGRKALSRPLPTSSHIDMVHHISDVMLVRPETPGSSMLTKAMGSVMEDVTNATYPQYKSYTKSQLTENVLLFVCSVLRVNLELELLQRKGGSPCLPPASSLFSKKPCLLPLVHVLGMHSKILTTTPYTQLWSHITGVTPRGQEQSASNSVIPFTKDVPVMLKDPVALLMQFVLAMPRTMEKEVYTYFVRALYNLVYTQALTVITCKFSQEERAAWRARPLEVSSLEGLMSHVITHLGECGLYADDTDTDPHIPAICQSVWSPQSVETFVLEYCMGFLRNAALLRSHLYQQELPSMAHPVCGGEEEFEALCHYLELLPEAMDTGECGPPRPVSSAQAVTWLTATPRALLQAWLLHFSQFTAKNTMGGRMLLLRGVVWRAPRLLRLPQQYDKLFQYYRKKQCRCCNSIPKDAAICLLCAQLICFKENCCQHDNMYEAVRHSISCCGGTGLFVIVQSSVIVVIRGPRATLWGSVYLDDHGEEDRDLKRGKPLHLSAERYSLLYQQWITHSFDRACKRWIFHKDNL